jgi:hypothetical protein
MSKENTPSLSKQVVDDDLKGIMVTLMNEMRNIFIWIDAMERRREPQQNPRQDLHEGQQLARREGFREAQHNLPKRGPHIYPRDEEEEQSKEDFEIEDRGRNYKKKGDLDYNLRSIYMKIPSFQGKNDLDAYIEWERKVEHVFECHNYFKEKKVKLAVVKFMDYALAWWD